MSGYKIHFSLQSPVCPICEVVILTVLSANIHINRVGPRCRLTSVDSGHNAFCVTCHITTTTTARCGTDGVTFSDEARPR